MRDNEVTRSIKAWRSIRENSPEYRAKYPKKEVGPWTTRMMKAIMGFRDDR